MEALMAELQLGTKAYLFCETCDTYCDLWKYGSPEDAGHTGCDWRYVTEEELVDCIASCKSHGCFEEMLYQIHKGAPDEINT